MNKLLISILAAGLVFSAQAFAHHDEYGEGYRHHHYERMERYEMRSAYVRPMVVYQAPQVIYRERVEYVRPVYYEPAPRYYERSAYPVGRSPDRIWGRTLGAVAGGVIGSSLGSGNGRVVTTAVGAVVGSVVGGNLAGGRY